MSVALKAGWGAGEEQEGQLHVCKGPGARWPLVLGAQESRGPREKQGGDCRLPTTVVPTCQSRGRTEQGPGWWQGPSRRGVEPAARVAQHSELLSLHRHQARARDMPSELASRLWTGPDGLRDTHGYVHAHTHTHTLPTALCTRSGTRAVTHTPASGSFPASSVRILQTAESQRQDCKGEPCLSPTVPLG